MTNHRSRLPASGRLRWRAALALAALGGAALSAAGVAGPAAASAHACSFPLLPGDLLVNPSLLQTKGVTPYNMCVLQGFPTALTREVLPGCRSRRGRRRG